MVLNNEGEEQRRELHVEENSVVVKFQEANVDSAAVDGEEKEDSIGVGELYASQSRGG